MFHSTSTQSQSWNDVLGHSLGVPRGRRHGVELSRNCASEGKEEVAVPRGQPGHPPPHPTSVGHRYVDLQSGWERSRPRRRAGRSGRPRSFGVCCMQNVRVQRRFFSKILNAN